MSDVITQGYQAAVESAAILAGPARVQWAFTGKQPLEMLKGIVTGRIPEAPNEAAGEVTSGAATYHAVLTPKGRMVADLRLWVEPTAGGGMEVRADVAPEAVEPLREHLARFLPPRLARLEDRSGVAGVVTVAGPGAASILSRLVLGLRVEEAELAGMPEGGFRIVSSGSEGRLLVMAVDDFAVPAFDVLGDPSSLEALRGILMGAGVPEAAPADREALRVERGRPAFGRELGPDVIPVEAGIQHRAVDYGKGCYTGQEVIIRIRDRGHVNRHLRKLVLDSGVSLPTEGTPLFREDREVGAITTSVRSPREGPLALGYVRREVAPGDQVSVGSADGPAARVEEIRNP